MPFAAFCVVLSLWRNTSLAGHIWVISLVFTAPVAVTLQPLEDIVSWLDRSRYTPLIVLYGTESATGTACFAVNPFSLLSKWLGLEW